MGICPSWHPAIWQINIVVESNSASNLLAGQQEGHTACKNVGCWYVLVVTI